MEKGLFHTAKNYLIQMQSLAIFFGIGLGVTVGHLFWQRLLRRPVSRDAGRKLLGNLFHYYVNRLRRSGQFEIWIDPRLRAFRSERRLILAGNHPSLLDVVMVISELREATCIIRGNLLRNPSMGGGALMAQYVTNDSGPGLIRQGREKLLNGETLLIFPEGTRTIFPAPVNPFKKGCALLAAATGAEVQTLLIEQEGRYLGKRARLLRPFPAPVRFRVHAGERFRKEPDEDVRDFSDRLEAYFLKNLKHTETGIYLAGPSSFIHSADSAHASREPDSCHPSPQL
ncbi:MAG TPA: lysophospholipid acyltransferase family protein [Chthoniobacterales bacterium]